MGIKKHTLFHSILLILVFIAYTLIYLKNTAFALESKEAGEKTSIEVTADVDKNEVTIGDKIKFGIHVKYRNELIIQFPEFNQQLGVFTVKETKTIEEPKKDKDGYSIVERYYVLSSYEIGRQTIPSLKIKYKDARSETEVVTNEVKVEIKGVLKEGEISGDIKDIHPPVDVPTNYKRLVQWIFVGFTTVLFSGIIYWVIKKLKKRQKIREQVFIKRAPHEIAYELLERLSKEDLIAKGLIKEYYYRITDILRHYIEDRFCLSAPERTTEEFLVEMAHTNKLENSHKVLIREFLERCDMVKYAKYGPSNTEIKETYDAAKRLIDETRERFEEKEVVVGRT